MNFTFFHRPEARKYNYKPQFYVPDEDKPTNVDKFDPDEFGVKLSRNWDKKRRNKSNSTSNMRLIVWMAFLVVVLLLFIFGSKFLF